jgi:hypothetical protein
MPMQRIINWFKRLFAEPTPVVDYATFEERQKESMTLEWAIVKRAWAVETKPKQEQPKRKEWTKEEIKQWRDNCKRVDELFNRKTA